MKIVGTAAICLMLVVTSETFAQTPPAWSLFYPLKVGNRWTYVTSEPKEAKKKGEIPPKKDADAGKKIVIEVERAEDYVRKDMKDGKATEEKFPGFILKLSNGDKVVRQHVAILEDGVHRISENGRAITPPLLILKFGLKNAGESWDWDSRSETTQIRGTCTIGTGDIRVPYKNGAPLQAISVTFSNKKIGDERHEITSWFVTGVGMVKQQVRVKNHERVLELTQFEAAK